MSESPKFWDKIAEKYAKSPIADEAAYQKKLSVTRSYLRPEMELLELGCGTGSTALLHAPFVRHIHAVDISSKMLDIAREKASAQNIPNVSFEQSAIGDFQAPSESYDAILALSVLHLVENKEAVIAKARRMLKPGGLFITSTACLGETMGFFRIIGPIGKFFGFFPLVKVFKKEELLEAITAGGFTIDHEWQPGKGKSVFAVAKKTA